MPVKKSRVKKSKPPPDHQAPLQFINAIPQSEAEKARVRSVVRSNATKYQWQHARVSESASAKDVSIQQSAASHGLLNPVDNQTKDPAGTALYGADYEQSHAITWDTSLFPNNVLGEVKDFTALHPYQTRAILDTSSSGGSSNTEDSAVTTPPSDGLLTLLGSGFCDPFNVYPSELPRSKVGELVWHSIQSLPQLLPPPPDNIQSPTADAWHSSLMQNRGLFHAFLYGAFIHDRASRGLLNDKVSPELFYTQTEAVKGLTRDLSDPAIFCTDEIILAVLCLAVNGVKQYTTEPARVPSQGPLKSLRMLDIYGILDVVPIHAEGLARLVAVRGGLQNIKMLGLAEAISYSGIMVATRTLTIPSFPFVSALSCETLLSDPLLAVKRASIELGSGFLNLARLSAGRNMEELCSVIFSLCDYTASIADYCNGRLPSQVMLLLADERNRVQHRLMSLPTLAAIRTAGGREASIYEAIRLATIVYSLLVTFPIPAISSPFAELSRRVKAQIPSLDFQYLQDEPGILLWILVMAAIASINFDERRWYLKYLKQVSDRLGFSTWNELREQLRKFLWYGTTNDSDGELLWKESHAVEAWSAANPR